MKALVLVFLPLIAMAAERQIQVDLPANPVGHKQIIINYDDEKNAHATLHIKGKEKNYDLSGFYCMKESDHFRCVGDDDSGRFRIYKDVIEIETILINDMGEDFIRYHGPKAPIPY